MLIKLLKKLQTKFLNDHQYKHNLMSIKHKKVLFMIQLPKDIL
jgi:hypothetical protein